MMANKANSLAHTKWMCKYHIIFTPKYRRKVIYNQYRKDLGEILRELCRYGSLTLAHSQNSQMSFMYGFFFVKFLFFTVVCVVIVV